MIDEANITGSSANNTAKLPSDWSDWVFGIFFFIVLIYKVNDPLFLLCSLLAVFIVWKLRKHPISITCLDAAILLIWLYHLTMIFLSSEISNSILAFRRVTQNILNDYPHHILIKKSGHYRLKS
jgi:hypothetical protein